MFKEWNSLTGQQQLTIGALVAVALANIVVFVLSGKEANQYTFYSVIITTTIAIGIDRISRFAAENRTIATLEHFDLGKADLHFIGSSAEGQKWITKHCHGLRLVENTVYRAFGAQTSYDWDHLGNHIEAIRKCINSGCRWKDIVLVGEDHQEVMEFFGRLTEDGKRRYSATSVAHVVSPMFQIMIFYYRPELTDHPNTVLFGWTHTGGRKSWIFESHNREVVDYFSEYYKALFESGRLLIKNGTEIESGVSPETST